MKFQIGGGSGSWVYINYVDGPALKEISWDLLCGGTSKSEFSRLHK